MNAKEVGMAALMVVGVMFALGLVKAAVPTIWAKIPGLNQF